MNKIKIKNKKEGFSSIEYIILLSIVIISLLFVYLVFFKDNTVKVANNINTEMNDVLNANEDNGVSAGNGDVDYSSGAGSVVYPESDKWDDASNFDYSMNASGVTITKYKGSSDSIVIPSEIENLSVIKIADNAFMGKGITSIKIPNTVQEIGKNAFKNNKLTIFVAPSSLTNIGDEAFTNNKLSAVSFNIRLQRIGSGAFKNNLISTLDTKKVITLGANAFYNNDLAQIKIGDALVNLGNGSFLEQGGLNGRAGIITINGDETRFNSVWESVFDDKFFGSKPDTK